MATGDKLVTLDGLKAVYDKVDGDVGVLKSDFYYFVGAKTEASSESDWENGDIRLTDGASTGAVNRIRVKVPGLTSQIQSINTIGDYKFYLFCWSDSAYLGAWDNANSTFNTSSLSGLFLTTCDLRTVYAAGAKYVRPVLYRTGQNISPSEGVNLIYCIYDNDIETVKERVDTVEDYVDDIKVYQQSGNLYNVKTDELTGRYYYRNNGSLSNGANANYQGFIVPVIPGRTYTFTRSNVLLLKADKSLVNTTGGNYDFAGVTTCYSGDAVLFAVSVLTSDIPSSGYVMTMGDMLDSGTYEFSAYANPAPSEKRLDASIVSGAIASGETVYIGGECAARDGYYAAFHGKFTNFGTLTIKYDGMNVTNAISVNSTNLVIVSGVGSAITQAHGLTIVNAIEVLVELKNSVLYVTVASGGGKYEYNRPWFWTGSRVSKLCVTAESMSFTESRLSLRIATADRKIWYFGDSYAEFNTNARLPYYVIEYGFDKNILFNTVSGSSTANANASINTLLQYGKPKYAINALGMNDGNDPDDSTPNAGWLSRIQTFVETCIQHNIVPVLCTIPTIPTVNNNGKNAWVKSSGYRYIDMADAVGADGTGTWYPGMLGQDNIHPSALGAVAQFMQLLVDMPEAMG